VKAGQGATAAQDDHDAVLKTSAAARLRIAQCYSVTLQGAARFDRRLCFDMTSSSSGSHAARCGTQLCRHSREGFAQVCSGVLRVRSWGSWI
jgi:hypothetical protein